MADQEQPFRRGMVIMAHPDDAEWTCAATVAKWCSDGWEVVYVLCTDGSKGSDDPNMTSEQLVKIREEEQLEAGRVLGLKDVVFLRYPDSHLEPTMDLRKDLAREIRRHRPDVVITENPERGFEPHKVKEVWIPGGEEGSDLFIDVAEHMTTAVKALKAHRSQVSEEVANKYFSQGRADTGKRAGLEYAEAFRCIKMR